MGKDTNLRTPEL